MKKRGCKKKEGFLDLSAVTFSVERFRVKVLRESDNPSHPDSLASHASSTTSTCSPAH